MKVYLKSLIMVIFAITICTMFVGCDSLAQDSDTGPIVGEYYVTSISFNGATQSYNDESRVMVFTAQGDYDSYRFIPLSGDVAAHWVVDSSGTYVIDNGLTITYEDSTTDTFTYIISESSLMIEQIDNSGSISIVYNTILEPIVGDNPVVID